MREQGTANPDRLVPCDGCGQSIRKPRRWCEGCAHIAPDLKALAAIAATYQLPPETRLSDAAAAIREQLRDGKGNARAVADTRREIAAQKADLAKRRDWWDLQRDLQPLVRREETQKLEEMLFGDFPAEIQSQPRWRWRLLNDFAKTTYKDDDADPRDLHARARAYLEARYAEDGFIEATDDPARDAFLWPTIGETRPGKRERS